MRDNLAGWRALLPWTALGMLLFGGGIVEALALLIEFMMEAQ